MCSKSDAKPVPPDTSIDQPENESITEMLMGAIRESNYAKEQPLEDREPKLAEHHSSEPMFVQYAEALEKCTKSAAEFIVALRCYRRPGKRMRNSWQQAMKSAELLIPTNSKFALSWTWHKKRRRLIWLRLNPFRGGNHRKPPSPNPSS
jgi:hypothetical protein